MASKQEWYKDGLAFQCTQCGNCCTGPPGAVWFNDKEAEEMAESTEVLQGRRTSGEPSLSGASLQRGRRAKASRRARAGR